MSNAIWPSVVWPMGCKKINSDSELEKILKDDRYIGQKKFKGIRAVMYVLEDGSLKFTTRGASVDNPYEPIDITHRLQHLTKHKLTDYRGLIMDCEMWSPEMDDSEIAGKLNYKSSVVVPTSIQPYFFDIINSKYGTLKDTPLGRRLMLLGAIKEMFKADEELNWAHFVDYSMGEEDKRRYLYEILESGEEGMVFKNLDSSYLLTSRNIKKAGYWYKYKRSDTVDAMITGATPPEQFYKIPGTNMYDFDRITKPWAMGWIGSLNFKFQDKDDGIIVGSCSGITDEMRAKFSDGKHGIKPEYIGRIIEVEFFERNKYGNCEHPRFIRLREELEK